MTSYSVHPAATATNTTHLVWCGRWIEIRCETADAYTFKNGRDAHDWLLWPHVTETSE